MAANKEYKWTQTPITKEMQEGDEQVASVSNSQLSILSDDRVIYMGGTQWGLPTFSKLRKVTSGDEVKWIAEEMKMEVEPEAELDLDQTFSF